MVDCPPIGVEYQRVSRGGARHARETVIPRGYAKGIHSGASERVVRLLNSLRRGPLQNQARGSRLEVLLGSNTLLVVSLRGSSNTSRATCDAQGSEDVMCKVLDIRTHTLGNSDFQ